MLIALACAAPNAAGEDSCPFVPGYAADLRGEILAYNSADPDVNSSLLVRSLQADRDIAWTTATIPQDYPCDQVTFIWLFGMDVNTEQHQYKLFVNDEPRLRFANPKSADDNGWSVDGTSNTRLSFRGTYFDRHGDMFGYATLRVPVTKEERGHPLRLRVVGESAGSRIWYMTFRAPVQSQIRAKQEPAVIRSDGTESHLIALKIDHLAEKTSARIELSGGRTITAALDYGSNRIEVPVPTRDAPYELPLKITVGDQTYDRTVAMQPVRDWQVYLVQHTHTDIGYTRPQTEILPDHVRYLDYALDYCDLTDRYPDDARFRWTCEGSWAVREFLRTRPQQQIDRFKKRVREGRIEVTAMFMNMSEITDENTYTAYLQPLRLFRQHGLPVTTAMQNDVNGAPWCLVDYFGDIGIKYVTMGQHGHRALIPFEVPTAFWWESRAGRRVLAYRADHYNTGNFWGIHNGIMPPVEREMLRYLDTLDGKDYPFDRVAVQHSGYFTDNSPPSMVTSDLVARWNEKYVVPHLRIATAHEYLQYVEEHHADALPTYKVVWPDWWTDGVGSAARETAATRVTQVQLAATQSLMAMNALLGSDVSARLMTEIQRISDSLLFYGEHTFGAAESIREPLVENSVVQWAEKAAYAWEAAKSTELLQEAAMGVLQSHVEPADVPLIVVVNTLNWPRSGLHEVYIDHEIIPKSRAFRIVAPDGSTVAAQALKTRTDGTYWGLWLTDVPAYGIRTYRIELAGERESPPSLAESDDALVLENRFYRLEIDPQHGAVKSLYDKELSQELVDPKSPWQLGQFIHETLGNRTQLEQFKLESYARESLSDVQVRRHLPGDIWQSIEITGESPTCHKPEGVRCEIRLHNREKLIEWHFSAMKKQVFDPEGIYVAFPFQLPGGRIVYEAQGGAARPDGDLLPGTASDWQTVQNFTAVRGDAAQIVLTSNEVPLMQFGDINLGKYENVLRIDHPHLFSWVMNNYWTTNFRASQQGEFRWSYRLTSMANTRAGDATRFGWGSRVPFLSRVLPPGDRPYRPMDKTLLTIDADDVILVSTRPSFDGEGVVLHLREAAGRRADVTVGPKTSARDVRSVEQVNVLEEDLRTLGRTFSLAPFEVMFVRLNFGKAGDERPSDAGSN